MIVQFQTMAQLGLAEDFQVGIKSEQTVRQRPTPLSMFTLIEI